MASDDTINSAFQSNPISSDLAGLDDDEHRESRLRLIYRLQRIADVGDSSVQTGYTDFGRLLPGSARAFVVDGTLPTTGISALPTTLLRPDYNAQTSTIPALGEGPTLAAEDKGLIALIGGYVYWWDGSAWQGSDVTDLYDEQSPVTGATGTTLVNATALGTPEIMLQDSGAGTPELNLVVTPPADGTWRCRVEGEIPYMSLAAGSSSFVVGIRRVFDPAGATTGPTNTDFWDVAGEKKGTVDRHGILHVNFPVPIASADRGQLHHFQIIAARDSGNWEIGRVAGGIIGPGERLGQLRATIERHG